MPTLKERNFFITFTITEWTSDIVRHIFVSMTRDSELT